MGWLAYIQNSKARTLNRIPRMMNSDEVYLRFLPYTWPTFAWSCPANGVASLTTLSVRKGRCFSFSYAWVLLIEKVILFHWALSSHALSLVPGRPQVGYFLTAGSPTVDRLVQAGRPYSCLFWGNKSKCMCHNTYVPFYPFSRHVVSERVYPYDLSVVPFWTVINRHADLYKSTRNSIRCFLWASAMVILAPFGSVNTPSY